MVRVENRSKYSLPSDEVRIHTVGEITAGITGPLVQQFEPYQITIIFARSVTGFEVADFSITNAVISDISTDDGITWTATITPTANSFGTNIIRLVGRVLESGVESVVSVGSITVNYYTSVVDEYDGGAIFGKIGEENGPSDPRGLAATSDGTFYTIDDTGPFEKWLWSIDGETGDYTRVAQITFSYQLIGRSFPRFSSLFAQSNALCGIAQQTFTSSGISSNIGEILQIDTATGRIGSIERRAPGNDPVGLTRLGRVYYLLGRNEATCLLYTSPSPRDS